MNREPATGSSGPLTPETMAELEELVRQRLSGRLRDFKLSIRDDGLVLQGSTGSHHAKQLAQHALLDVTRAPIRANEIHVCAFRHSALSSTGVAAETMLTSRMPAWSRPRDLTL
jgi:hypothetical protein